jgi:hypothetical protein
LLRRRLFAFLLLATTEVVIFVVVVLVLFVLDDASLVKAAAQPWQPSGLKNNYLKNGFIQKILLSLKQVNHVK